MFCPSATGHLLTSIIYVSLDTPAVTGKENRAARIEVAVGKKTCFGKLLIWKYIGMNKAISTFNNLRNRWLINVYLWHGNQGYCIDSICIIGAMNNFCFVDIPTCVNCRGICRCRAADATWCRREAEWSPACDEVISASHLSTETVTERLDSLHQGILI